MGKETLKYYFQIFRYHKMVFLGCFSLSLLLSIAGSFLLPRRYRSQCTVMLEVKTIENPLAQNRQTSVDPEQIKTIRNLILSNNRLGRVITSLGLAHRSQNPSGLESSLELERMVNQIRDNIVIDSIGTGLFTITYTGEEPHQVRDITNTLARMFIEENLELTGSQAQVEYNFVRRQLKEYKERLESSEKALKEFKEKNIGQMPGEANINLTHLQKLQDEFTEVKLKARELEQKRTILQKQLAEEQPSIVAFVQREDRIRQLRIQLAELSSRYTENYPDVIKLKAEMEKEKASAAQQKSKPKPEVNGPSQETSIINPIYQKLKEEVNNIEVEINLLQTRRQELEKDIAVYAGRVSSIPAQEEELARLTRDNKVNEEAYETLLKRLAQIHMVREMEKTAHQSRFKILDPARLPLRPIAYNPWQITLICIILSLATGLGSLVGFEYLCRTVKDESDIQDNLHIPVVANIPLVFTLEEKQRHKRCQVIHGVIVIFWVLLILFSLMRNVFQ
ncbi:MAG: XrtA system polysaccharide chain length determinant [bacterium]